MSADAPFAALSPDLVLAAAEQLGIVCDGRLFALNSYENRVYQLGSDSHGMLVLKFYRPGRWTDAAILEEHAFALELLERDLPVAAPMRFEGRTLWPIDGHPALRFAVFPRLAATPIEIEAPGSLELVGRTIGRLHACGALARFAHRPTLSVERLGWQAREALLEALLWNPSASHEGLDAGLRGRYAEVSERVLEQVEAQFDDFGPFRHLRLHGDCHLGNILWNERGPVFVDLDDCMMGPRIQDLWMFLNGSLDEREGQWQALAGGYRQFFELDERERELVEPLRALRMIHHAAWVAARWDDPAFPRAFPWFTSARFWQEYLGDLWQQLELIGEIRS